MTEPKERTSGAKAVGTLIEYRSFKKHGSSEAELPHFCITPGGVEADGAHLLLPLHAVDRQLPLHGGGRRPGGIAHRPEDGPRQHQGQFAKPVPNQEEMIASWENIDYVQFNMDFQAKKYGQTYEEFLKNARELTGIKDAEEALDKAYNFLIEATLLVYKVEK